MYLLPYLDDGKIKDGICVKALCYCKKRCSSSRCKKHYQQLYDNKTEGYFQCPEGLSSFVVCRKEMIIIFSGFRCKDHYNKDKKIADDSFCPIITETHANEMIAYSSQILDERASLKQEKDQYEASLHEIRKLNSSIKNHCESLLKMIDINSENISISPDEAKMIADKVKTIWVSSCMEMSRYEMIDFDCNTGGFQSGSKFNIGIFSKFEKFSKLLRGYKNKNVRIVLENNSYKKIKAYTSFELIPFLLLENAVKYSDGSEVFVSFFEGHPSSNQVIVEITSVGPYCTDSEIQHIFEKNFRGKNAEKMADGNGIGLYFVKELCDLHNIDISVSSDNQLIANKENDFSIFKVKLVFHDVFSTE